MTQSFVESESEKIAKITNINRAYHVSLSKDYSTIGIDEQARLLKIYDFLQEHSVSCLYHFTDIYI